MHAPDGLLQPSVAVITALISVLVVATALRITSSELGDRQIPLAGVTAAFLFAAQMVNFPVAAGTTGHLLGGALAAVLLGPWVATVIVSVVIFVQALFFADGGLSALGYNTLNMAIVTVFGGWAAFRLLRRIFPSNGSGFVAAGAIAASVSVVLSSAMFSIEWLFGATAPVPFDTVLGAMIGVHALIGVGEGVLTALVLAAVLSARPDLVVGARDLAAEQRHAHQPIKVRVAVVVAALVTLCTATVVSQFAAEGPDGLERVSMDQGFASQAADHAFDNGLFSDYATDGISNETLSLAFAGLTGVLLTFAVAYGMASATRSRRLGSRAP